MTAVATPAVTKTVTVILLKPFVFSLPPRKGEKLPTEMKFTPRVDPEAARSGSPFKWLPTEIEIPQFIADHPWIKEEFADGAIERPEVTAFRAKEKEKTQAEERKKNAKIIRQAEEAFSRTTSGEKVLAARGAKVEDELNTPVNQLGRQQGVDIDPSAMERELNTSVGELRQQQQKPGGEKG